MNKNQLLAQLNLTAEIVRAMPNAKIYNVTRNVEALGKLARQLHKRYEAMCSYQWANTEKYERATDRLETKAGILAEEIGIAIGFQRDPRGWPLVFKVGPYETRLG